MRKRFKVMLKIIVLLIILLVVALIFWQFKKTNNSVSNYEKIMSINNYDYTLEDRDSKLMKDNFVNLKKVLESNDIDYEKYAEYLSKLFIIDLFTMNNKDNKYDVGSCEYVLPEILDNYKLNVSDTLYKYMEDKNTTKRDKYPIVKDILDYSIESSKYTYNEVEYDAYNVNISWEYESNNDYPTKGNITLINKDNKLFVVAYEGVD